MINKNNSEVKNMTNKSNSELRMELRIKLLSILNKELDLARLGTDNIGTAYTDVAYEMLYVFDSLITGSTLEYKDEKHDAILGAVDCVMQRIK